MEELFEKSYFDAYENFEQFKKEHPYLAKSLKEKFPEPEWKEHPLYYYPNPRIFAEYQLKEGPYKDKYHIPLLDFADYDEFSDFINWKVFIKYFLEHSDKTKYYYNETTQTIVETAIHWELS